MKKNLFQHQEKDKHGLIQIIYTKKPFELDTKLLQIDMVTKLGLPSWKLVAR
jgi:hypothetical protein